MFNSHKYPVTDIFVSSLVFSIKIQFTRSQSNFKQRFVRPKKPRSAPKFSNSVGWMDAPTE